MVVLAHLQRDKVGVDVDQLSDETEARRVRNFTDGVSDGATGALYKEDRVSKRAPDVGHAVTGRRTPASGHHMTSVRSTL